MLIPGPKGLYFSPFCAADLAVAPTTCEALPAAAALPNSFGTIAVEVAAAAKQPAANPAAVADVVAAVAVALFITPCITDLASLMLTRVSRMDGEKNLADMPMTPVIS